VSSSCTSVYLDGSEVRGSTNATFTARYGNVESTSSVTVWVPELPLDIQVEDVKLNAIHGWKAPADRNQCRSRYQQSLFEVSVHDARPVLSAVTMTDVRLSVAARMNSNVFESLGDT
jgi:Transmembrane protein family 132